MIWILLGSTLALWIAAIIDEGNIRELRKRIDKLESYFQSGVPK